MNLFTKERIEEDIMMYYDAEKIAKNEIIKANNAFSIFDSKEIKECYKNLVETTNMLKGIEAYFASFEENIADESIDIFLSSIVHSILIGIPKMEYSL